MVWSLSFRLLAATSIDISERPKNSPVMSGFAQISAHSEGTGTSGNRVNYVLVSTNRYSTSYKSRIHSPSIFDQSRTHVNIKMAAFWVVAPCSLVEIYWRFRAALCLHHKDDVGAMSPWWWRHKVQLKHRWTSTILHGATTQKTAIFIFVAFRHLTNIIKCKLV
jgi:hypothetical protein